MCIECGKHIGSLLVFFKKAFPKVVFNLFVFKVGKIITSAFRNIISQSASNTIAANITSRYQKERNPLQ